LTRGEKIEVALDVVGHPGEHGGLQCASGMPHVGWAFLPASPLKSGLILEPAGP
jgi:hypothetical protein